MIGTETTRVYRVRETFTMGGIGIEVVWTFSNDDNGIQVHAHIHADDQQITVLPSIDEVPRHVLDEVADAADADRQQILAELA